jgi:hypothetical protein
VSQGSGFYPRVLVDWTGRGVIPHAGCALVTATVRASLSSFVAPRRTPRPLCSTGAGTRSITRPYPRNL